MNRFRKRYYADKNYRLGKIFRNRLRLALLRDSKQTIVTTDLGCSISAFRRHLERMFQPGMSWDNYGEWHIDHIRPIAAFDLTDAKQRKKACYYKNMQPMWAKDNQQKGANVK